MTTQAAFTIDILSVLFFLIAGLWLVAALVYSLMVLCFLRMRAQGRLANMYDDDFGRIQLCRGCYLPCGCIFRRYARHLQLDDERPNSRYSTRAERRAAMEALLLERSSGSTFLRHLRSKKNKDDSDGLPESPSIAVESATENAPIENPDLETGVAGDATLDDDQLSEGGGPTCSICLGDYESPDAVFCPKTCSHQFHEECILDWLQRQAITECPCCRVAMVTEDEVWKTVKRLRKEKRRKLQRQKSGKQDGDNEEPATETEEDLEDEEEGTSEVTR